MTKITNQDPERNVFVLSADSLNQRYFQSAAEEVASLVEGVQFTKAIATASDTNSAMPGLAAGVYSDTVPGWGLPQEGATTIAEQLSKEGYQCGLWTDNYLFGEEYGYSEGFVAGNQGTPSWKKRAAGMFREGPLEPLFGTVEWVYFNVFSELISRVSGEETFYKPAEVFHENALSWLRSTSGTGNCCWIHYMDTHHPYEPPTEYLQDKSMSAERSRSELSHLSRQGLKGGGSDLTKAEIEDIRMAYDACCEYLGDEVSKFISTLIEEGHFKPSRDIFVFTADHGESLDPERYDMMGHVPPAFWDDIVRVPFVFSHPEWEPGTIDSQVSLIDLMPTVLSAVGTEPPEMLDGEARLTPDEFVKEHTYFVSEWGEEERGGMRTYRGIRSSNGEKVFGANLLGKDTEVATSTAGWEEEILAKGEFDKKDDTTKLVELLTEERGPLLGRGDIAEDSQRNLQDHLRDLGYVE